MQLVTDNFVFSSLQLDLSVSKVSNTILYNGRNIRITARESNTLMSITNEKGTSTVGTVEGNYLGHCLINQYLVVFTHKLYLDSSNETITIKEDRIIRYNLENYNAGDAWDSELVKKVILEDDLNFSNPIETLGFYENEDNIKVYWVDGENQPRVINIMRDYYVIHNSINNNTPPTIKLLVDFIPKLKLEEQVTINQSVGGGQFHSGVLLYAFTYYNKFLLESNIFYTSGLLYVAPKDRGGAPDEIVDNIFYIKVDNLDINFDYLRVYSILRTSLNSTPLVKIVQDIDISTITAVEGVKSTIIEDNGILGETVDPNSLLMKNRAPFSAGTLTSKDGTLFLGDIKYISTKPNLDNIDLSTISPTLIDLNITQGDDLLIRREFACAVSSNKYRNQLHSVEVQRDETNVQKLGATSCSIFKSFNVYRLGILLLDEYGYWSAPITPMDDTWDLMMYARPEVSSALETDNAIKAGCFLLASVPSSETNPLLLVLSKFKLQNYKKIRGVVVLPNESDRIIAYLGLLCKGLESGATDLRIVLPHWDFWFWNWWGENVTFGELEVPIDKPRYISYISNDETNEDIIKEAEIQGIYSNENKFELTDNFYSFYSPDFNDILRVSESSKFSFVGTISKTNKLLSMYVETETLPIGTLASGHIRGWVKGTLMDVYEDAIVRDDPLGGFLPKYLQLNYTPVYWKLYIWQLHGSLNNDIIRPANNGVLTAKLATKYVSMYYTGGLSYNKFQDTITGGEHVLEFEYFDTYNIGKKIKFKKTFNFGSNIKSFVSLDYVSTIRIGSGENYYYEGNIDTSLVPSEYSPYYAWYYMYDLSDQYHTRGYWNKISLFDENAGDNRWYVSTLLGGIWRPNVFPEVGKIGTTYPDVARTRNYVRMKYKSTAHLILDLYGTPNNYIWGANNELLVNEIPVIDIYTSTSGSDETDKVRASGTLINAFLRRPGYRDTMFGGSTKEAFYSNTWIPCGEPEIITTNGNTIVKFIWGDAYFQQWECLKVFPYTRLDENQVSTVLLTDIETYKNICGRYDKNRGFNKNLTVDPTNTNLINSVYSLTNNFFNYKILNEDLFNNTIFPNLIVFSSLKLNGEMIDTWTNIVSSSSYALEGDKGRIVKLTKYKNNIICFQDRGIAIISFNPRVLIPTSDNIPIELSNSYKLEGHIYVTLNIGCSIKPTIQTTPSGIYFINSLDGMLYHYGDLGPVDLSIKNNMKTWFLNNTIDKILYDSIHHDIYCITLNDALCFSEVLGGFESFFDYSGIQLIESYGNKVFTTKAGLSGSNEIKVYKLFEGKYNRFFDSSTSNEWGITFICNGSLNGVVSLDKTFSTIEYKLDMFKKVNNEDTYVLFETPNTFNCSFNKLQVTNEYQDTGIVDLVRLKTISNIKSYNYKNSNLQNKLRTWRIQIPRQYKSLNRIRNPWCKITLKSTENNTYKAVLHDLKVQYFV